MLLHQKLIYTLTCWVSIFTTYGTAQKTETFYNYAWKPCEKTKACYYSTVEKTDSGYLRGDYFINSSNPQMIALYEDSGCKIMNGNATWYYANGYVQRKVRMIHNKQEGIDIKLHNNGLLSDSGNYHNGKQIGCLYSWHSNGYLADSTALLNDSMAVSVSWFDNGSPSAAGRELHDKPHGPWVYYYANGNKAAVEMYDTGRKVSVRHFNETGTEIPVDTNRNEHAAEFRGGINKWKSYLERSLVWPTGYHFENGNLVVIQLHMTINEQGDITDVYIVNPFHPVFDKVAYDVISKGPKWIPAIQHNRPVKYRFIQSVTFAEQ